ncbi:unnamed protein product [Thelazia callipaeda]|uniref:Rnh202 triple barrel domain-containing protein n=1 Tax=Thelazia callipaeda TaxID=103827 RepID=A0A0N5D6I8_THECL|nr:unnamed protein product [Thelazia callipaeda]
MNSVELTSNCPHEENEKLNDKCSLKAAISDCVQYKTQLSTRFIISNGELFGKQLHSLRHPRTGRGAIYAIGNERIEELLKFDDGFRSILFGNNVISNGSLSFLVPVNPVLLLLPYLRKYAQVLVYYYLIMME